MMIAVRLVFLYAAYNVYSYNQHSGYSRLDERLCKMVIMIPRSDSGAGEEGKIPEIRHRLTLELLHS